MKLSLAVPSIDPHSVLDIKKGRAIISLSQTDLNLISSFAILLEDYNDATTTDTDTEVPSDPAFAAVVNS